MSCGDIPLSFPPLSLLKETARRLNTYGLLLPFCPVAQPPMLCQHT